MKKLIGIDLVGGDRGYVESLPAVINFLNNNPDWKIKAYVTNDFPPTKTHQNLIIEKCKDKISQDDKPIEIIRKKKTSTLGKGLTDLISNETDALVSAANSGALVTGSYLISGTITRDVKPVFAPIFTLSNGRNKILLDAGANLDFNSDTLVQYAKMGKSFINILDGISPKVALLNIGSEQGKGSALLRETFVKLTADKEINFIGNLEPNKIFKTKADVIVSDPISGNVLIKSYEGAFELMIEAIKKSRNNFAHTLGFILIKKSLKQELAEATQQENAGGSIILGLNHLVLKVHGNAKEREFYNTLNRAKNLIERDFINRFKENWEK